MNHILLSLSSSVVGSLLFLASAHADNNQLVLTRLTCLNLQGKSVNPQGYLWDLSAGGLLPNTSGGSGSYAFSITGKEYYFYFQGFPEGSIERGETPARTLERFPCDRRFIQVQLQSESTYYCAAGSSLKKVVMPTNISLKDQSVYQGCDENRTEVESPTIDLNGLFK